MESPASSSSLWVVENSLYGFEDRGFNYHWSRPEDFDPFGWVSLHDLSLLASSFRLRIIETDVLR